MGKITDSKMREARILEQDKRKAMMEMMDQFKMEKQDLRRQKEEMTLEQSTVNRLLKNEIIDMSERMERMEQILVRLDKRGEERSR